MTVYFVQSGRRIKIGFTENLAARLGALKTSSSYPLKLLGAVRGGFDLERAIHKRLANYRTSGEWFRSSAEVLEVVRHTLQSHPAPDPPAPKPRPMAVPEYIPKPDCDDSEFDAMLASYTQAMSAFHQYATDHLAALRQLPSQDRIAIMAAYDAAKNDHLFCLISCAVRREDERSAALDGLKQKIADATRLIDAARARTV
jgi:hypothetical protein